MHMHMESGVIACAGQRLSGKVKRINGSELCGRERKRCKGRVDVDGVLRAPSVP